MTALQLQTFAPAESEGVGRPDPAARRLARAREAAYEEGYLAGQASATEAHLQDQALLSSQLVETLIDAGLTNEAARRHVAASLAPMVRALCAAVAPALARAGLTEEIARLVAQALERAPNAEPIVRCAPEVSERIEALLRERSLKARVEPSPELLSREAEVRWDHGFDRLDLDACVTEIEACVTRHLGSGDAASDEGSND